MIRSFACRETRKVFDAAHSRKISAVGRQARRKLLLLDNASRLDDVRFPPGNRLEALAGDRQGQHSIRVNDQWRIVFVWRDDGPHDVEIVDFH